MTAGDRRLESLRARAEAKLQELPKRIGEAGREQLAGLVHDLQVHQIELEIQNEELRNVQSELETARDAYAQLFDEAPVGYLILDGDGRIEAVNRTFATMTGTEATELRHRPFARCFAPDDQRIFLSRFNAWVKQPDGKSMTLRMTRKGAPPFWTRVEAKTRRTFPATTRNGDRLLVVVSDVSEEVSTLRELSDVRNWLGVQNRLQGCFLAFDDDALYAEALEVVKSELESPLGYFGYIDEQGNLECPSMTREVYGACQVANKSITFPRDAWAGLWGRSLVEKRTLVSDGPLRVPDGHLSLSCALAVPLIFNDRLLGQFVVANRKGGYGPEQVELLEKIAAFTAPMLFEQRRAATAEAQLRQAQKMESVGRLAGGVAHDFNNLLTGMIGNIEMAELELPGNHPSVDSLHEAKNCAERAADLVQRLLSFSRKQMVRHKHFDLRLLVSRVHQMLRRVVSESISFHLDLEPEPAWVHLDLNQVEQILVNLVINARDAMPDGGDLTIRLRNTRIDDALKERRPELDAAAYVELTVTDTGHGMAQEVRDHVFDPFFTTKEPGVGTGLGLSVVYGSVMQSAGHIEVESTPGSGTTFRILLPMAEAPAVAADERRAPESTRPGVSSATVLLVDDELALRELYRRVLSGAGYQVLTARDGADALRVVETRDVKVDLLITDVIMPRMNGPELAARLRERLPALVVLFTSGYTENAIAHHGVLDDTVNFLGKPYRPDVLLDKVRMLVSTVPGRSENR